MDSPLSYTFFSLKLSSKLSLSKFYSSFEHINYFTISATSNLFFVFVVFLFSDWNPKCSNLMLFDCNELLINMKSQFRKPPLMTDNLVEPTKHLNVIMLTYCSSKWAGPMECPPILISFYVNVDRSNMVGFTSSCFSSPKTNTIPRNISLFFLIFFSFSV